MDDLSETGQLEIAVATLRRHTTTPDDLFIAYWNGFGFEMPAAVFDVPNRSFFLYRGTISENGSFNIAPAHQAAGQQWMPVPAFIWPADQSWCVARDVDPHWAGICATRGTLAELLQVQTLDVVPANPALPQPSYC